MYIASDIEKIAKTFKKVLAKHKLKYEITFCNNYKAIKIEDLTPDSKDEMLYMRIRLFNIKDTYTYDVEIANISIPKQYRRNGILTEMVKELNKCRYVNKIKFISVCTAEMKNWCDKNGFKPYNFGSDYSN